MNRPNDLLWVSDVEVLPNKLWIPSGERLHFAMERSTMLSMGKSENPLFRLGHFPLLFVCSPEDSVHIRILWVHWVHFEIETDPKVITCGMTNYTQASRRLAGWSLLRSCLCAGFGVMGISLRKFRHFCPAKMVISSPEDPCMEYLPTLTPKVI